MITFSHKGNFSKTYDFLNRARRINFSELVKYGEEGVAALKEFTPKKTGKTADSWYYRIHQNDNGVSIEWLNSNIQDYVPIAVIIQYGHATKSGSWVEGVDYINPAIQPIFERISESIWKGVTKK